MFGIDENVGVPQRPSTGSAVNLMTVLFPVSTIRGGVSSSTRVVSVSCFHAPAAGSSSLHTRGEPLHRNDIQALVGGQSQSNSSNSLESGSVGRRW